MHKEQYEKPLIIKHQSGLANKFGRRHTMRTISEIDGVKIKNIAKKFGSPVFVFSEPAIRKHYKDAVRSFSVRYPKVQFAWSYKTNYLDAVCQIFHQEGSWAEVVSEHEYQMAIRNGVSGDKIIYNGPYKPVESIKQAIADGANIHIDNYDEFYQIERIVKESGQTLDVSIRLNMDTGIHPVWDRFGFNYDNGEAFDVLRRMAAGDSLRLKGVHSHIGTCVFEPTAYSQQVKKMSL